MIKEAGQLVRIVTLATAASVVLSGSAMARPHYAAAWNARYNTAPYNNSQSLNSVGGTTQVAMDANHTMTAVDVTLPSVSINDVSLNEGNSGTTPFNFTVTLSSASSQTVQVSIGTISHTAEGVGNSCIIGEGKDYIFGGGLLTFLPGETSKNIPILVCGDKVLEPNETFSVIITSAIGATIARGQGTGTILNDDGICASLLRDDFDGDCKSDIAVYRKGSWFILGSSDGVVKAQGWGEANDIPVPRDYDGDGKTDIAVFRDGTWFILRSSDNGLIAQGWGEAQDSPAGRPD